MIYQIIAVCSLYISVNNGQDGAVIRGPIGCGDTVYGDIPIGGWECWQYTPISADDCVVAVDTCLPAATLASAGL